MTPARRLAIVDASAAGRSTLLRMLRDAGAHDDVDERASLADVPAPHDAVLVVYPHPEHDVLALVAPSARTARRRS